MGSSIGPEPFVALSDVARSMRAIRRDATQLRRAVGNAARQVRAIAEWSKELPELTLDLSETANGDEIVRGLCSHQPWPFRYRAVAVIALPTDFASYLRGRSRQAVRTNRRKAVDLGLSVTLAASPAAARKTLLAMLDRHAFYPTVDVLLRDHVERGHAQFWFATTHAGVPTAMAAVVIDRGVAQLATLQVALDAVDRSATRYLLSTEIVRALIDQSATHLIADSMLFSSPGVVYLQQRLGFEPMNIVVPRHHRRRPAVVDADAVDLGDPVVLPSRGAAVAVFGSTVQLVDRLS